MGAAPDDDETISLSRDGKVLLRAAAAELKFKPKDLAAKVHCTRPHIRTLLGDETNLGKSRPTWSSKHVPALCRILKVPIWAVVAGLRPEHRVLIESLERVRLFQPSEYDTFVGSTIRNANGRAALGGWRPDEDPPEDKPKAPRPRRPTLRPVP